MRPPLAEAKAKADSKSSSGGSCGGGGFAASLAARGKAQYRHAQQGRASGPDESRSKDSAGGFLLAIPGFTGLGFYGALPDLSRKFGQLPMDVFLQNLPSKAFRSCARGPHSARTSKQRARPEEISRTESPDRKKQASPRIRRRTRGTEELRKPDEESGARHTLSFQDAAAAGQNSRPSSAGSSRIHWRSNTRHPTQDSGRKLDDSDSKESPVRELQRLQSFESCVSLSRRHHLKLPDVRQHIKEFTSILDVDSSTLSCEQFCHLIKQRCNLQQDEPLPDHFLNRSWKEADLNNDGRLDIEEYLQWCRVYAWAEEIVVADFKDREFRRIARTHRCNILDLEEARACFNHFMDDETECIDFHRFRDALASLLKVIPSDITESRLRHYWMEASNRTSKINLETFSVWYIWKFRPSLVNGVFSA